MLLLLLSVRGRGLVLLRYDGGWVRRGDCLNMLMRISWVLIGQMSASRPHQPLRPLLTSLRGPRRSSAIFPFQPPR